MWSYWSRMGLKCNITSVLIRREKTHRDTDTWGENTMWGWRPRSEWLICKPRNTKDCQQHQNLKGRHGEFPGGSVVRTLCFYCRGHGFNPLVKERHRQKKKRGGECMELILPWRLQRKHSPVIPWFLSSRSVREYISVFKATQSVAIHYGNLRRLIDEVNFGRLLMKWVWTDPHRSLMLKEFLPSCWNRTWGRKR